VPARAALFLQIELPPLSIRQSPERLNAVE
jgi:hypothetical protein